MQGRREAWQFHFESGAGVGQFKRDASEQALTISADRVHQAQSFAIGADQNVLAVVERVTMDVDAARAATQLFGGFEYGDFAACGAELDGSRQAGPAAADDCCSQALIQVRQASHSLRSGVSEVRWLST